MRGKYNALPRYLAARCNRAVMRALIRPLVRWQPMDAPRPGYTVIVGVVGSLARIAVANLTLLTRQQRDNLHEIILVCDRPRASMDFDLEAEVARCCPDLPVRVVYWSERQQRMVKRLRFAWVNSWLSWCIGIGAAQTRHALLHDLDAMLIETDVLERQYRAINASDAFCLGARPYSGNGVEEEDGLVATFELMFDVQRLRSALPPVALFNHVYRFRGRTVEMDTFLHAQTRLRPVELQLVPAEDMVHPSQLFCQYNDLHNGRSYVLHQRNNLPMIPYFLHLGGDAHTLAEHRANFESARDDHVRLLDLTVDASRLSVFHADWLCEQARRIEQALFGGMRDEVADYFKAVRDFAERSNGAAGHASADVPQAARADAAQGGGTAVDPPVRGDTSDTATINAPARPARIELSGVRFDPFTELALVQHMSASMDAGRGGWIVTSNLDHLRRAQRDASFQRMLRDADVVVADGMPVVWASRVQGTPLPQRVAGSSLVSTLAEAAAARGRSIYMLGGAPGAAEGAAETLQRRYPGLRIAGIACPPIGFENDAEAMDELRRSVRESEADIVYVALGSPKQEWLIEQLRIERPEAWWIGVGISLSFLSGQVQRAPVWMQRLGLEWLHRLSQEPGRLARRYLVEGLPFMGRVCVSAVWRRMQGTVRGESAPHATASGPAARRAGSPH